MKNALNFHHFGDIFSHIFTFCFILHDLCLQMNKIYTASTIQMFIFARYNYFDFF